MGKPKLNFYRDKLTPKQAAEGMNAAARNAKRLYEDAEALLKAKRFPTACAVAILSIEESGKLPILREIACMKDKKGPLNDAWRRYSDHRQKNAAWLAIQLMMNGAKTLNDIKQTFDPQSMHPDLINIMKQFGFYTDCYGEAEWAEPEGAVDEKMATTMLDTAKLLLPKHETTEREMELWVEHIGEHWGKPNMAARAMKFEELLFKEGLRKVPIEDIRAFYGIPE
jgi:AbiV family abortive infection protein